MPQVDPYDGQARNAFPATVAPGTNQAFWVDIFVGNGTAPGIHPGTVRVRWASATTAAAAPPTELALALKVHTFALPSISRYQTTFNCSPKGVLLGRMNGSSATREQKVAWQRQYVDLGLMHRVTFSDFLEADEVSRRVTHALLALAPWPVAGLSRRDGRVGVRSSTEGVTSPLASGECVTQTHPWRSHIINFLLEGGARRGGAACPPRTWR